MKQIRLERIKLPLARRRTTLRWLLRELPLSVEVKGLAIDAVHAGDYKSLKLCKEFDHIQMQCDIKDRPCRWPVHILLRGVLFNSQPFKDFATANNISLANNYDLIDDRTKIQNILYAVAYMGRADNFMMVTESISHLRADFHIDKKNNRVRPINKKMPYPRAQHLRHVKSATKFPDYAIQVFNIKELMPPTPVHLFL